MQRFAPPRKADPIARRAGTSPDRISPLQGRHAVKIGLLGFSKVGKTTLFNILTGAHVAVDKYASGRAEPNVGVVKVPEPRLDRLAAMFKPKKTTYAHVDFLDIQGLEKGEAKTLDLKEMRNVDAIAHVVRDGVDIAHLLQVECLRLPLLEPLDVEEVDVGVGGLLRLEHRRKAVEPRLRDLHHPDVRLGPA